MTSSIASGGNTAPNHSLNQRYRAPRGVSSRVSKGQRLAAEFRRQASWRHASRGWQFHPSAQAATRDIGERHVTAVHLPIARHGEASNYLPITVEECRTSRFASTESQAAAE
jgi:hypothetical protein